MKLTIQTSILIETDLTGEHCSMACILFNHRPRKCKRFGKLRIVSGKIERHDECLKGEQRA